MRRLAIPPLGLLVDDSVATASAGEPPASAREKPVRRRSSAAGREPRI
jgi:hypothetical protein